MCSSSSALALKVVFSGISTPCPGKARGSTCSFKPKATWVAVSASHQTFHEAKEATLTTGSSPDIALNETTTNCPAKMPLPRSLHNMPFGAQVWTNSYRFWALTCLRHLMHAGWRLRSSSELRHRTWLQGSNIVTVISDSDRCLFLRLSIYSLSKVSMNLQTEDHTAFL